MNLEVVICKRGTTLILSKNQENYNKGDGENEKNMFLNYLYGNLNFPYCSGQAYLSIDYRLRT
jgi:hypothetical protein